MMFLQGLSGPTTQLLGTTPVFKCNLTICYGSDGTGATHTLFKTLQATLNRFAGVGAFSPVVVDGFIGSGTVNAAQRSAQFLAGKYSGQPTALALAAMSQTRESIAKSAQILVDTLSMYADQGNLTAPPIPPPGPPSHQLPPAPGDMTLPGMPPPAPGQSSTWTWVAVGVGVVALAGFIYYQTQKKGDTADEESAASSM